MRYNSRFRPVIFILVFVYTALIAALSPILAQATLSKIELEKLVKPIALYPDLLLQQVLAASTFPEQILDAALFHEQAKAPESIVSQPWDASVKAIANYPSLITKMAGDIDWTLSLASAFVNQNVELRKVIQDLRAKAQKLGNLKTSSEQKVTVEDAPDGNTIIIIEPAQPQVIYIPAETTTTVYEQPVSSTSIWAPVATFGVGMAIGYAMGDDDDDYYGGYYGPGFWHREDAVNNWVDYRRDRWDDAYDFANDRQDFRQDSRDDWREYRQDLGRQRQDYLKEKGRTPANLSPEKRAEAQTRANNAKSSWQNNKGNYSKSKSTAYSQEQASQRLQQARNNPQVQNKAQSFGSGNSQAQANQRLQQARNNSQVQNKAQNIRSNASYDHSDFSYSQKDRFNQAKTRSSSGGGFSGMNSGTRSVNMAQTRGSVSRGSGGFSRGGGGAMRSGGGGRRR